MRLFVTGAFGYLGLAVLRRLGARHEIVAFGHPARTPKIAAAVAPAVTVVPGELADAGHVLAARGSFDGMIHLAGGGGPKRCEAEPVDAVRTNVLGTIALLEAARAAGVPRLLFASTIQVYGTHRSPPRGGHAYVETDSDAADDLYGIVKAAAETAWTGLGGGVALRIANIYGAGAGVDVGVQGAVERFARAAATGGELTIFGTGSQRIDYVHVDDVVDAFEAALERQPPAGAINIGGGAPVAIGDLARLCTEIGTSLGGTPRLVSAAAPDGKIWPDRSLAIAKAAELLGWRPRRELRDGLRELIEMMRKA